MTFMKYKTFFKIFKLQKKKKKDAFVYFYCTLGEYMLIAQLNMMFLNFIVTYKKN